MVLKPKIEATGGSGLDMLEIELRNPEHFGKTMGEVMAGLPPQTKIVALRTGHQNQPASHGHIVAENDVVLVVGPSKEALESVRRSLGVAAPGAVGEGPQRPRLPARLRLEAERRRPGDRRPRAARARRASSSPRCAAATPTSCRGPTSCSSSATGSACSRTATTSPRSASSSATRSRAPAEFSYISIGLGMALGFLLGAIQIPLPMIGKLSIGLSGVLIVALILGMQRPHRRHELDRFPLSANLVPAQPRPDAVPGPGRHVVGAEVRRPP
jgi:putative transport protein